METYAALKVIVDGSGQLLTWAFALTAASIAMIVSVDYLRPSRRWRRIYLLFLPAWFFVGLSVYFGNQVSRRYMAAVSGKKDILGEISQAINTDFGHQQLMFEIALLFFALWLLFFVYWWIFGKDDAGSTKRTRKDSP